MNDKRKATKARRDKTTRRRLRWNKGPPLPVYLPPAPAKALPRAICFFGLVFSADRFIAAEYSDGMTFLQIDGLEEKRVKGDKRSLLCSLLNGTPIEAPEGETEAEEESSQ